MGKAKNKKKTDSEILFPEVSLDTNIGKIDISPFTLGNLVDVAPNIEAIVNGLKIRGTSLLDDDSGIKFTVEDLFSIYLSSSTELLPILEIVTKRTEEELRSLIPTDAIKIISLIIQQNGETFKNFFDPFFGEQVVTPKEKSKIVTADEDEKENMSNKTL